MRTDGRALRALLLQRPPSSSCSPMVMVTLRRPPSSGRRPEAVDQRQRASSRPSIFILQQRSSSGLPSLQRPLSRVGVPPVAALPGWPISIGRPAPLMWRWAQNFSSSHPEASSARLQDDLLAVIPPLRGVCPVAAVVCSGRDFQRRWSSVATVSSSRAF